MKILTVLLTVLMLFLTVLCTSAALAQVSPVVSNVYYWDALKVNEKDHADTRPILEGSTTDLAYLDLFATTIKPGQSPHTDQVHDDFEEMIIVKDGKLKVTINDERKVLGPGSVAVTYPGDRHSLENAGDTPVTFFVYQYRSKAPVDLERGKEAGGSFMVDWNDVEMEETETGGRRQIFDRPTSMFKRFEMHVSTLNEGRTNHAAHTHRAEEFVVVIKSDVEMLVGESYHKASAGDIIFLASEIPHALNNIGTGQTEYFAFQWQ